MTLPLFAADSPDWLKVKDGELLWIPNFLSRVDASYYYECLYKQLDWQQQAITLFGKSIMQPRLQAWHGDKTYAYSGLTMPPNPWISELLELKSRCEQAAEHRFNTVFANLYRDGQDSMGWHQDNEKELGINPVIASLSLGGTRRFVFKHLHCKSKMELELTPGSLLVMAGSLQHHWQHALPKTQKPVEPRINLTFRHVVSE